MDPVNLHLLSCHVPLVGAVFTVGLVLLALRRREAGLELAADAAALVTTAGCALAWATGPAALQALSPWMDPAAEAFADRHASVGDATTVALGTVAGLAMWGLFLMRAGQPSPRWRLPALGVLVLVGLVLSAWAGHEGGRIRHEELRHGATEALAGDRLPWE